MGKMEKGLVQIFYGNGRGKTTAALGTALRACGSGLSVHLIQFMKNGASSLDEQIPSEIKSLSRFENFSFIRFGAGEWVIDKNKSIHAAEIEKAIAHAKEALSEKYDVIIADEILYAVQLGLLSEEQVIELINSKPRDKELILTGSHKPLPKIFEAADLVSEVRKIKHQYDIGVLARKGIDY